MLHLMSRISIDPSPISPAGGDYTMVSGVEVLHKKEFCRHTCGVCPAHIGLLLPSPPLPSPVVQN